MALRLVRWSRSRGGPSLQALASRRIRNRAVPSTARSPARATLDSRMRSRGLGRGRLVRGFASVRIGVKKTARSLTRLVGWEKVGRGGLAQHMQTSRDPSRVSAYWTRVDRRDAADGCRPRGSGMAAGSLLRARRAVVTFGRANVLGVQELISSRCMRKQCMPIGLGLRKRDTEPVLRGTFRITNLQSLM